MVVITLEAAPPRLRGALTRWLQEVIPGVYVGRASATVRDLLWASVKDDCAETGRAVMVHTTNNEQGFTLSVVGDSNRTVIDVDGLQLVAYKHAKWRDWIEGEDD